MFTTALYTLVMSVIEIMCCKLLFEAFCVRRKWESEFTGPLIIIAIICFCCLYTGQNWIKEHLVIKLVIGITSFTIAMWGYFCTSIKKSFIITALYFGLSYIADYLVYIIIYSSFKNDVIIQSNHMLEGLVLVAFGKILEFIIILFIKKSFGRKSIGVMADDEWVRLLAFPLFTVITLAAIMLNFAGLENQEQENVLIAIAFGMVVMNILVYYLISDIISREVRLREKTVAEAVMRNQLAMYTSISENYERQRRKTHEFKNQIMCIESLLMEKQYDKLQEYVKGINKTIAEEKNVIDTKHVIVNSVLNTKYREASNKGIMLTFRVNDLSGITISDEDIVIILSNLLDNAIEACEKCSGKKFIRLKFIMESKIILSVQNTYDQPLIIENGEIKTTKKVNREEHGLGLKNVISIIEKYHGEYSFNTDNGEFSFMALFPQA